MSQHRFDSVVRHLQQLVDSAGTANLSDRQLLDRFARQRDEAAFALLLRRHGPLVQGVCRRVLRHVQDAEDAFQATFLVLARNAGTVRRPEAVGNWLYCVAYRLALRIRRAAPLQLAQASAPDGLIDPAAPAATDLGELCAVVDQEVLCLPERCRIPVLLCYLQGQTRDQAAQQLGWSLRTLERRLKKGRELLRGRLAARGMTLTAALLAAELARTTASASLLPNVVAATVRAARLFLNGDGLPPGLSSEKAVILAKGALQGMFMAKVQWAAALVLTACILAAGIGLWARQPGTVSTNQQADLPLPVPAKAQPPADALPTVRLDLHGDPLPPRALARLGTIRFRHAAETIAVAFAPDGKTVVSAAADRTLRVWDVATGQEKLLLYPVRHGGIAVAPDGKTLASAGGNDPVQLWDLATGKQIRSLAGRFGKAIAFAPDGQTLAATDEDKRMLLLDVATGNQVRVLTGHRNTIDFLAFAPDGKTLASASCDTSARLWDVPTGKQIHVLDHGSYCAARSVAFAPDGKTLASADQEGKVRLWDVATGKHSRLPGDKKVLGGLLAFAPDGKTLAAAGGHSVTLLAMPAGTVARTFGEPGSGITSIAFAPDGKTLATASDNMVHLWNVATGTAASDPAGHIGALSSLVYAPDGKTLATAGHDKSIRLWDPARGQVTRLLAGHEFAVTALAFAPDGKMLASADIHQDAVRLWDVTAGKQLRGFTHKQSVRALAFAPDGKALVSGGQDRLARLWDVATGQEIRAFAGHTYGVETVAFAPDGRTLATAAYDEKTVRFWDVATGREVNAFVGEPDARNRLAFSPDGKILALVQGSEVQLWDLATSKVIHSMIGQSVAADGYSYAPGGIHGAVAFAPDGKTLATANVDRIVRLWDVARGQEVHALTGHLGAVAALAFAPDGKTLASASGDTTTLLWDVAACLPPREPKNLATADLEILWEQLPSDDLPRAYQAIASFIQSPRQSLPFLRGRVQPEALPTAERLRQLLADLESNQFAVREKASAELQALGELAAPALRRALEQKPALETGRRIEALLETRPTLAGERLRIWRVIQVLEGIGNPEAQAVLDKLAGGEPVSRLTTAAQLSAQRLAR